MENLITEVLEIEYPMAYEYAAKCSDKLMRMRIHGYAYELQKLVFEARNKNDCVFEEISLRINTVENKLHELERQC